VHSECEGVVECTALVIAESCTEYEDRLTLFGILDEIRPNGAGGASFVVYTKFEGCEHVSAGSVGPAFSSPTRTERS